MTARLSGVKVYGLQRGQTPVADFYCARCGAHRRITGRENVRDYLRSQPIEDHRATCPAT